MPLILDTTYRAILAAARERRFIGYGEIATANGESWQRARQQVFRQLGELMTLCDERDWPFLSAIVVPKEALESGKLDGPALEGFVKDA